MKRNSILLGVLLVVAGQTAVAQVAEIVIPPLYECKATSSDGREFSSEQAANPYTIPCSTFGNDNGECSPWASAAVNALRACIQGVGQNCKVVECFQNPQ